MKINKRTKTLIFVLAFIIVLSQVLYLLVFHDGFSNKQSVWGDFGSFFGGFVGTILGFINLLVLIVTISIQNEQLKIMKEDYQTQLDERTKNETKQNIFYYEKSVTESMIQISEVKECFKTKDYSGDYHFTNSINGILNMYSGIIRHHNGESLTPDSRDEKLLKKNITRYISIIHILIDTASAIINGNIDNENKDKIINRFQVLLNDSDLKFIVCYRELIKLDVNTENILNRILGVYSEIGIIELAEKRSMNINEIAIEKGIMRLIFKELP